MRIEKYGVTLKRVRHSDIEMLRHWRNAEHIRQTMEFRAEITPEMQEKWFLTIDNFTNFYLIIHYEGKDIGLINAKNVDWEKQEFESGVFIHDTSYYQTFVPAIVSLMITDVFFNLFGWPSVYAHILKTNNIARQFNEMLGYKLCENQENVENQLYKLRITDFEQKTIKIRKALDKLYPDNKQALFIFDSYDVESGLADFTINLIKKVFPDHKSQTKGDLLIYPF